MKGFNRQSQRAEAAQKHDNSKREHQLEELKAPTEFCGDSLKILREYELLTKHQKNSKGHDYISHLSNSEKIKLLWSEVKELRRKESDRLRQIQHLQGHAPETKPMPRSEAKYVYNVLQHFRDIGFERITYIMLKHGVCELIQQEKANGYKHKFTSSMTQVKNYLKPLGIATGPRVYVSVGDEGELLKQYNWLEVGPIELFGGCANGEQRTHWIECNTGVLAPDYK